MRKDIFSSTRRNIMGMSIGIVMGTLMIFAMITQAIYQENLFNEVDHQLLTHKNMIMNETHIQYVDGEVLEVILPSPLVKELINYVWQDDRLVKDSPHLYKGSTKYPIFPNDVMDKIVSIQDGSYSYRGIQFMYDDCRVQILLNVDMQLVSLKTLQEALLIAFLILILIGLMVSFYLAKVALRPLYRAYSKQAAFIEDASHEMRTPLAVIKGKLELIARKPEDSIEKHYKEISAIMSELSGLEKLNKDLLLLSKEDMGGVLEVKKIFVQPFFNEIAEFYDELSKFHELSFQYDPIEQPVEVEWDLSKVKRCISILLENAIKYSYEQGKILLQVMNEEKYVKVIVSDTGRGIKKEELEKIFERFYRNSEIRASGIEGSGIGLSLLKSLAYTMDIKVKVVSQYGKGSSFMLWIPKNMEKHS